MWWPAQTGDEWARKATQTQFSRTKLPLYDELCDVCHPNAHGVLWHFAALGEEGVMTFDDGAKMSDNALGALIFAALVFVGEEPAISRLETKLDVLGGYRAD
jgi:hypothetical protein